MRHGSIGILSFFILDILLNCFNIAAKEEHTSLKKYRTIYKNLMGHGSILAMKSFSNLSFGADFKL